MSTHRTTIILVITLSLLLCIIEAGPARSFALAGRGNKNPRTIRAPYRNDEISTARGFGKRDAGLRQVKLNSGNNEMSIGSDLFHQERKFYEDPREVSGKNEDALDGRFSESVPIEWMVNELTTNPVLTRVILQKFVDTNRDGLLSARELMATPMESNENY